MQLKNTLTDKQKLTELAKLTDKDFKVSPTRLKAWGKLFIFNDQGEIIRIVLLENVVSKNGVSYVKHVVLAEDKDVTEESIK
jgi:hypothetical protein